MKINFNIKISLLVGILVFITALFVGNYSNSISSNQLEKKAGEKLLNLAKHTAEILDREMLERYREVQFAATMPALTNENSTVEEKRAFLEKMKKNQKHHEWIGYALPDGTVVAGTNGYLEGKNASARPWLPGGLKGPYIGDVHDALLLAKLLPNTSGESIYFTDVAFPVKNDKGEVLGVLCTHLMWQWTRDMIRSIQKSENIEIFLLSNDGMILVGPKGTERQNLSDISSSVENSFKNETNSYKLVSWNAGTEYLTAQTISNGFEEYKGFGWKVIIREPLEQAFLDANKNSNAIFMISILSGVIAAIIGIVFANIIISPMKKLYNSIVEYKQSGNFNIIKTKNNDEIAELQNELVDIYTKLNEESALKDEAEKNIKIALQVFDQSLEGILITNKDNKAILVNKSFTEITGYSQEEMYLKNPNILSSDETSKEFYEQMWEILQKEGKWNGDITNQRKDGTKYLEHLKISTLKNEKGEITNYLATFNSGF